MNNSSLIEVLKTFSKSDTKEFDKFLKARFFGTDNIIYKLYKTLAKYHPEFPEEKIVKEEIFKIIYNGKKINPSLMRKNISILLKCIDEYFLQLSTGKLERLTNICLLEEYRVRNLNKQYNVKYKEIKNKLFTDQKVESDIFFSLLNFEIETASSLILLNKREQAETAIKREYEFFMYMLFDKIENHFSHKQMYAQVNKNFSTIMDKAFLPNFNYDGFIKSLGTDETEYGFLIKIFYYSYKCYQDIGNYENYRMLKKLIFDNYSKLDDYYKHAFLFRLTSITTPFDGNPKYSGDRNFYLKTVIRNKYFKLHFNYLQVSVFLESFYASLRVDDNEFAEELLKIHINEVSEDFRENLYNFCMCGYLIHKKKFKEALSYNVKVKKELIQYKKMLQIYLFEIYYALNYYDNAFSTLESLKYFVASEKKLGDNIKKMYNDYYYFAKKILEIKTGSNSAKEIKSKAELLLSELLPLKDIADRLRLTTKLKELINS